jgi:hypothetical protein
LLIQCGGKVPARLNIFLTILYKTIYIGISMTIIKIYPFMLKNLGECVYHGSKAAYSFPMSIIWEIGKLLYSWTDVDET